MTHDVTYQAAHEAEDLHRTAVPHAVSARLIRARRALHVVLSNGVEMSVPVDLLQDLQGASLADLAEIEMTPLGTGLHWPRLDADVLVEGLIHGVYGTRRWMAAQMGRAGGSSSSEAKAAAARRNGAKGGRPKKWRDENIVLNDHNPFPSLSSRSARKRFSPCRRQRVFRLAADGFSFP